MLNGDGSTTTHNGHKAKTGPPCDHPHWPVDSSAARRQVKRLKAGGCGAGGFSRRACASGVRPGICCGVFSRYRLAKFQFASAKAVVCD